ncbi:MAG: phosphotyrosine protein phosphatase [Thermoleophilia bacterium]|nr:phosphotyrosine protein phosphatase [Thermoleophilia bacterium]
MHDVSVLFICMGNICRSPMAEAVFRVLVDEAGLVDRVRIDSAGTHSYHLDHAPHPETQAELGRRGVAVGEQVSRLVTTADLQEFDLVVAMDHANMDELATLVQAAGGPDAVRSEVFLLLDHATGTDHDGQVPDPYYAGGYDHVFDLIDDGARGLLELVRTRLESAHH